MSNELNALKGMKQLMWFWPYLKLCSELQKQIDALDEEILNTLWENEKKYTLMDLKKIERLLLKQFLDMPSDIIKEFDNIITTAEANVENNNSIPDWLKWPE